MSITSWDLTLYDASAPHKIVFLLLFQLFTACCYVAKTFRSSCGAHFLWGGRPCLTCLNPPLLPRSSSVDKSILMVSAVECRVISMGQGQEVHARRLIGHSSVSGGWVLLQNCHLSLDYVVEVMDQLINTETIHENFRLWVTTEVHPKFPITFLQVYISPLCIGAVMVLLSPIWLVVATVAALHQGAPGQIRSTALAPPCHCFASVIVWTENKNVTISDRFVCFILTVKQSAALVACVLRATTEKGRQWPGFLTSKWSGSLTALAFAPDDLPHDLTDLEMTRLPWRPGAATASQ